MPLHVRLQAKKGSEEPDLVPAPICDFCGEPIANVRDGVWLLSPERYDLPETPLLVAHHDRSDDKGDPVRRCHSKYEARELAAGREHPGWLELRDLIEHLITGFPGARASAAQALNLHERDVWLLRWIAAGMPADGVSGQPKPWSFEVGDAAQLADRIASSVSRKTGTEAVDDDIRYGQFGKDLRERLENIDLETDEEEDDNPF